MRPLSRALIAGCAVLVASQAVPHPAVARSETRAFFRQTGVASWYGPEFHGKRTASGERFDQNELTAAHRQLPLGAEVTVTNLANGRSITVAINDRGPYVGGRVIDLSQAAAQRLGIVEDGLAKVRIEATPRQLALAAR